LKIITEIWRMSKVIRKKAYDGTARCLIDGVFGRNRGPKKLYE